MNREQDYNMYRREVEKLLQRSDTNDQLKAVGFKLLTLCNFLAQEAGFSITNYGLTREELE